MSATSAISQYLYVPVGLTARFRTGERWVVAPTVEYDVFLSGRQESQLSDTGIGYSDASNTQKHGYGYRAYLMLENGHWAFGPWLHYWNIKDSDTVDIGLGKSAYGAGELDPGVRRGSQIPVLMPGGKNA